MNKSFNSLSEMERDQCKDCKEQILRLVNEKSWCWSNLIKVEDGWKCRNFRPRGEIK